MNLADRRSDLCGHDPPSGSGKVHLPKRQLSSSRSSSNSLAPRTPRWGRGWSLLCSDNWSRWPGSVADSPACTDPVLLRWSSCSLARGESVVVRAIRAAIPVTTTVGATPVANAARWAEGLVGVPSRRHPLLSVSMASPQQREALLHRQGPARPEPPRRSRVADALRPGDDPGDQVVGSPVCGRSCLGETAPPTCNTTATSAASPRSGRPPGREIRLRRRAPPGLRLSRRSALERTRAALANGEARRRRRKARCGKAVSTAHWPSSPASSRSRPASRPLLGLLQADDVISATSAPSLRSAPGIPSRWPRFGCLVRWPSGSGS